MTEKKRTAIGRTRKVIKLGGSLAVTLPPEFVKAYDIKEGDDLLYAAGYVLQFIPMSAEIRIVVELEPSDKLEIDYNEIVEPSKRVLIPAGEDQVEPYLNLFRDQIKNLHPGYGVTNVDMVTVTIDGQKYYQPGRITMQRIKGLPSSQQQTTEFSNHHTT
jgi:bifunctional DNA-binding transcriptional regulator/antitoxin component of YhaV-PrlF toxin-antitoxin module